MEATTAISHPRFADLLDPSIDGRLIRAPGRVVERGGIKPQRSAFMAARTGCRTHADPRVSTHSNQSASRELICASSQGEPIGATGSSRLANALSADNVLQHFRVQRQVGDDLLDPAVLTRRCT